jgi:ornithine decarboxylase
MIPDLGSATAMRSERPEFNGVGDMLRAWQPREPVYCIHPHVYRETAREFLRGFPGRVLYAVKANDDPDVVELLHGGGVAHFDCASLAEIALVRRLCPAATCYFMVPVSQRGEARAAQAEFGVRHFMLDHADRLPALAAEIALPGCVVFARMAVSHASAMLDLSSKFGAPPGDIPGLLASIRESGAEPALAFNVGSLVTRPEAYRHAIGVAAGVLEALPFRVRLVDMGGGFPRAYPGFPVPPMADYFAAIEESARRLPLAAGGVLLAEPGRALAAPGLSAVVEVLLRKDNRLYINDGMYGIFWELRFKAHVRFPVRALRDARRLEGPAASFRLYGPTCDASDVLPGEVELPADVRAGDYLEFGQIGAYSLSGRTRFNGHYSERIVRITAKGEKPPA